MDMELKDFYVALRYHLSLPFEVEQVMEVTSSCGTTWIDLKDGSRFYLSIGQCEPDNE
jgi:hypothetical protein